jgi:DMSO/TMAO reductase YedYZ molybdopterin-dependent catalytic subunit
VWRLHVTGRVKAPLELTLEQLAALGMSTQTAVLDCTSGWAMRTDWQGTPLRRVLAAARADPEADHVRVRSVTGWMVRLQRSELDTALLATHVAGRPLPAANGAPLRLVAPERRGLDWIKWIDTIEVA